MPPLYWAGVSGRRATGSGWARLMTWAIAAFIASRSAWAAVVPLPAVLAAAMRAVRLAEILSKIGLAAPTVSAPETRFTCGTTIR